MGTRGHPDRAVSEFTGVAILIAVTVLVTASVGLFVLVVEEENTGPPDANFSFQHLSDSSALLVTFDRGDPIGAGNITVQGAGSQATWAELANADPSEKVGPGATVQLSDRNAFGEPVGRTTTIEIFYVANGTRAKLDSWNG